MQGTWTRTLAVIFALGLVSPMAIYAEKEGKEGKEEKVSAEQLPPAVKAAFEKEGAKLDKIEKETEEGKVVYEAEAKKDGKELEIKVAEDGTVIAREAEDEDEDEGEEKEGKEEKVAADQLPPAVKAALEKEGAKLDDVEKENEDGKVVYEADAKKDGKELEIKVAEDGTVISREAEDEDEDEGEEKEGKEEKVSAEQLPPAVKATLEKEGAKLDDVEKEAKDGKVVFETDVKKDGKEIELKVAEDGSVISREAEKEDEDEKEEHEGKKGCKGEHKGGCKDEHKGEHKEGEHEQQAQPNV